MITRRRLLHVSAASAFAPALIGPGARAQTGSQAWPNRHVRLIVPIAAGGAIDGTGRLIAAHLSELWGQQVVVENRPGAATNIAAEHVARSEPDGYTLYMTVPTHAINRFLYPSLNYDPIGDFAPVTLICAYPNIMVVPNSSPATSVIEFIAHAKASKGKLSFASAGHGTTLHLAAELFKRMAGVEMVHVPYRGAGPAFNDLIPGRIDVMFNLVASSLPLARNGQLRALAVTTPQRIPAAPSLPTVSESGVPGFEVSSWSAFFVPAKTPADIVRKIHADTVTTLANPAVKTKLEDVGVVVIGSTPDELAIHLKAEMDKWGPIISRSASPSAIEPALR
jgi:tripartite-type tricarboxylate transporter receptor subunit TctC